MPEPFADNAAGVWVRSYPVTILDDIQLADAAELSLLHTDCTMQASECRAMHGRIIVKGEAVLHCLAMQEDDAVRVLNSSTPFTQILELPEAEEDALTAVRMTVSEADCRLESDGMLSCTISAQAMVLLRQERMAALHRGYVSARQGSCCAGRASCIAEYAIRAAVYLRRQRDFADRTACISCDCRAGGLLRRKACIGERAANQSWCSRAVFE